MQSSWSMSIQSSVISMVPSHANTMPAMCQEGIMSSASSSDDSTALRKETLMTTSNYSELNQTKKSMDRDNGDVSRTKATINLCKCFSGASIFAMPWAFSKSGLLLGSLTIILLALLSYYTLDLLGRCSHMHPKISKPTYPEIARYAFGTEGYLVIWMAILCMTVGVCGSYLVFIASEMCNLMPEEWAVNNQTMVTSVICVPMILLSLFRSYSFLTPFNALGLLSLAAAMVIVVLESSSTVNVANNPNDVEFVANPDYREFPLFLGNAAFVFLIHSVVLPVEQGMRDRGRAEISGDYVVALKRSVSLVTAGLLLFAGFAYSAFGESACGNIMSNLDFDHWATKVVIIALCVNLLFTYPLFLFPMTEALELELFGIANSGKTNDWRLEMKRNCLRAALVVMTGVVASLIPRFELITGLTGAFGNNVLALILPPVMYFKLANMNGTADKISTMDKLIGYFTTSFGIAMLVLCVWIFTESILNDEGASC